MGHLVTNSIVAEVSKKHKISEREIFDALSDCRQYHLDIPRVSLLEALKNYKNSLILRKKVIAIKQIYNFYLAEAGQKEE